MTVSAPSDPGTQGRATPLAPQPAGGRPCADCVADGAGGLSFDVDVRLGADPRGDAVLLHRRGGTTAADRVSLPLVPTGEGRSRAVLPSTVHLAEGRWDAYLTDGDATAQRLRPGVHDLRSLVDRRPPGDRSWLGVRVPYATKYGNLTVRAWLRWPHAEAGEVRITEGGGTLEGRLYGADLHPTARLEAHARRDSAAVSVPVARRGQRFVAALPCGALAARRWEGVTNAVWDLWLRPAASVAPVRVSRILDDIPDKSQILRYPPVEWPGATVAPVYTADNNLALRLRWSP